MSHQHSGLTERQQSFFIARYSNAIVCMQMHDDLRIVSCRMDRRVDGETSWIDKVWRFLNHIAI